MVTLPCGKPRPTRDFSSSYLPSRPKRSRNPSAIALRFCNLRMAVAPVLGAPGVQSRAGFEPKLALLVPNSFNLVHLASPDTPFSSLAHLQLTTKYGGAQ